MQYLNVFTRLGAGIYFFWTNRENGYDAYFIVWLVAGANTNAVIGGAAGLNIADFPGTLLQPVICGGGILFLAITGAGTYGNHGSQPACTFKLNLVMLVPLFGIGGVIFLLVLASGTQRFNQWFIASMKSCLGGRLNRMDEVERAELLLRIFWTVVVVCVDAYWVVGTVLFIRWYNTHKAFLNHNQYHITWSQIQGIIIAAITILPTIRLVVNEIDARLHFSVAENSRRRHQDILQEAIGNQSVTTFHRPGHPGHRESNATDDSVSSSTGLLRRGHQR
ncbi:hypothetical protein PUNSTDRAFT_139206 [Punctularia strigosozonata HHB-11173 SS5]|uniref:Uncharacterized protein n=1 Tax=Punctularia strigosozonata (strain HHB-11173) TaxID=741275 RepID=R7S0H5_PUNST|nr:uncharacterized protein PUNSTDRAFT_139206 [Punctularia strigosozonata HHB-11173 SS5]EIN03900.1 hypothetical protein PUNSTDRAFT_139206 [Punctularia strigosozonata HHB-11173 SS5]